MASRRDPLRTTAVLIPALLALAIVPLLLRQTYHTVVTSTQGRALPTVAPAAQLPATPASLLVVNDNQGRPVTAALLAPTPGSDGGLLLVLPLGTQTIGATGQPERLDATYATTGLDGFARSVEGLLGITVRAAVQLALVDLGTVVAPLTPITVALSDPVRATGADGGIVTVAPAGSASLGGLDAAAVMAARADESELVRLDRVVAVWKALLASSKGTPVALGSTTAVAAPGGDVVLDALAHLAGGPNQVRLLTDEVVAASVGTPDERFLADPASIRLLMAEVLPGAVSPANASLRLRVLNPSGDEAVAYQAVAKLTFVTANVILVDSTVGPVPATSGLTYADTARQAEVAGLVPVLGLLSLATTEERIDGIDATITLGQDFVASARRAAAATTTTQPVPATAVEATPSTIDEITTTTKKTP